MQSDAGLVQNIADAHKSGTDLGRQTDSLCLAAGERTRSPGKGEVAQSHVHQKSHSGADLLQDLLSDQLLIPVQGHPGKELLQLIDGERCDLIYIFAAYGNGEGFLFQTHAAAKLTGCDPHETLVLLLHNVRTGLPVFSFHIPDQPLKGNRVNALPALSLIVDIHLFPVRTVQQHPPDLLRILLKGRVQIKMVLPAERLQHSVGKAALIRAGLPSRHGDGALVDALGGIRDHQLLIKLHLVAETEALGAGSEGVVEGEAARLDLADADPAVRAGKALAERHGLPAYHIHFQQPVRQLQHALHRIREPACDPVLHHETIHHHLNIVLYIFVQLDLLGQLIQTAVHAHPHIAAALRALEHLCVLALASSDHRRQKLDPRAFRQRHDLIHHLIHALSCNLAPTGGTVGDTDPGIQQPEIIIDLRHCAHRGSGVAVGGFLVDGDCRGQSFDLLHIGLLHLSQKLAGIGGKRLHIPSLPLRIYCIKCQRGLAGS